MHYTTKARPTKTDREYIVIRHPLGNGLNNWLMGVKFCNGVGIVEKGSKVHRSLDKSPILKKRKEYGLEILPKYGFRTKDIALIWGKDVYYHYLDAVGLNVDLTPKEKPEEKKEEKEETKVVAFEPEEVEEIKEELKEEMEEEQAIEDISEELIEAEKEEEVPELTTEEIIAAHKEMGLCIFQKKDGNICKNKVSKGSPSGLYCFGHIKKDPELERNKKEE